VRWLGSTTPQQGFDKPELVVAFTTSPDNKTTHKLTVGAQNNDGTLCAHVDGRDGTFAMSNSELDKLKSPLEQQAAVLPSPPTGATATPAP